MRLIVIFATFLTVSNSWARADNLIFDVDAQPLRAQVHRLTESLAMVGRPLSETQLKRIQDLETKQAADYVTGIQQLLDELVIANVHINAESRVKAAAGKAKPIVDQNGWTVFLIKVHNEAGITPALQVSSPSNEPIYIRSRGEKDPDPTRITDQDIEDRWLELGTYDKQPMTPTLTGLALEYRILAIYSSAVGQREASLAFDVGQGTQDLGFRSELPVLFTSRSSTPVTLRIFDYDGKPY